MSQGVADTFVHCATVLFVSAGLFSISGDYGDGRENGRDNDLLLRCV